MNTPKKIKKALGVELTPNDNIHSYHEKNEIDKDDIAKVFMAIEAVKSHVNVLESKVVGLENKNKYIEKNTRDAFTKVKSELNRLARFTEQTSLL